MGNLIEYECPYCGGRVEFDSVTQKMKCPFCDSSFEIDELDYLEEEEDLKELAEQELSGQLMKLLEGKNAEHILVVGLGNREVTADAVGPLTVDGLLITRHYFLEESVREAVGKKYRRVSAFVPGVMAQTGMETMELIKGVVEEIKPDVVLAVDALAAGSPKRLNTTIQLTDAGISPGAGVGNNRKELNETSLGCPVIAIGVPTVLDAVTIAKEEVSEDSNVIEDTPKLDNIEDVAKDIFGSFEVE